MVAFDNVKVNQRVEVLIGNEVHRGTVKYKGSVNGQAGDWVGVALDYAYGLHNGMVKGRRYFSCQPDHGVFVDANLIRFLRLKTCLKNTYRTVKDREEIKEELFETFKPAVTNTSYDPIAIDRPIAAFQKKGIFDDDPKLGHQLRHSVSNFIPSAVTRRPKTAQSYFRYNSWPVHVEYNPYKVDFISKPTIPSTHMPYEALRKQVKRGWDNPHSHLVREWSVNNGRDSVCRTSWNNTAI